jgi:PAS domain S-box-containing protein
MQFIKHIRYIWGDVEEYSLEYRLFLSTIIVAIIISLLGTIISIILSSSVKVITITLSTLILFGILYYFVRFRRIYKPFIAPTILLAYAGIAIIWIVDGGMNGSNLFIGFVILILTLIIVPDKNKKYVISLFIFLIIVLYLVQLYKPELITPFSSEKIRWVDSLVTAIYSSLFIFFIVRFIHKSYNIERQRANNSQLKFRALSENSQDCITRYDRMHRHIYMNKAGLELRGLSKEQLLGKTHRESGLYEEEEIEMMENAIEDVFETKKPQYKQFRMGNTHEEAYFDLRFFPEFDSKNDVSSVIGVSRNITELKQSEIELQQLNIDKDRFISILGHDLKSPLLTLLSISKLLVENVQDYDKSEIQSILTNMMESTKTTYNLLEDILTWTKAQSGKIPYNPQNILFADICENVIEILGPNATTKNIGISCQAANSITVIADNDMLRTILRNLLSNAIKFTNKDGEIKIRAYENPASVSVSVSDNGIGISAKKLAKLFKMTEVISTKGTDNEKGTGLGLLLCQEFVEKHGGKLWAESEVGKGSVFNFTLPIATADES